MNCKPSMSGRIMSSTTTTHSGATAFSSPSAPVLACSTSNRVSCERSAASSLRTESVSSTTRTIGLWGIQRGYHATPARPPEIQDHRDRQRRERQQQEKARQRLNARMPRLVDDEVGRDAVDVVHQHAALPLFVDFENILVMHQVETKRDHIKLYEKCYECAERTFQLRDAPTASGERHVEKHPGEDALGRVSRSTDHEQASPLGRDEEQPYEEASADQRDRASVLAEEVHPISESAGDDERDRELKPSVRRDSAAVHEIE